jgi:uncharacterized protein
LKTCLPDINVWIALASDRHVHHETAKNWFAEIEPGGAAFCRVTQMGFLRLITNRHVMGADVVTQKGAGQVYKNLLRDQRVTFLAEPAGVEDEWQRLTQGSSTSTNTWTDAYLAAFATIHNVPIVSFDGGIRGAAVTVLRPQK